jgi:hypothetical protein
LEAVIVLGIKDEIMVTIVVILIIWISSGVLAYLLTEAAVYCCGRRAWDRYMREFSIICGILLGPVYLLISAEVLLFALMGSGLKTDHKRRYRDS